MPAPRYSSDRARIADAHRNSEEQPLIAAIVIGAQIDDVDHFLRKGRERRARFERRSLAARGGRAHRASLRHRRETRPRAAASRRLRARQEGDIRLEDLRACLEERPCRWPRKGERREDCASDSVRYRIFLKDAYLLTGREPDDLEFMGWDDLNWLEEASHMGMKFGGSATAVLRPGRPVRCPSDRNIRRLGSHVVDGPRVPRLRGWRRQLRKEEPAGLNTLPNRVVKAMAMTAWRGTSPRWAST